MDSALDGPMLMDAANELAQENPNLKLRQLPTSIDLLNPDSPALAVLATEHNQHVHYHSVIGVDTEIILKRFLTALPVRMEAAKGGVELHSVILDVDDATGKARASSRARRWLFRMLHRRQASRRPVHGVAGNG